ncbi:hypothetical protein S40285_07334 [Stachybotrys chlorohalonatus IBT 40285]|uniref:Major facilitator superfamily (MFS) profile domain-containing protein n=1 Tax=Stachybotrys chlorohalonatus (strain IBT 40285) TaxID=1283841 RepID=A0A084Q8D5_STAC4|nr:hypothetical protein S40285_07334 [Stachybotrys chlorohalonata IBT 40285]
MAHSNSDPPPKETLCQVEEEHVASKYENSRLRRVVTPKNCRWNPDAPSILTTGLCLLYALAATVTVANLYYNQPVLNRIAETFNVSYEASSQVATLMQSGYAAGIVFVLPLGDMLERRCFIISLVLITATLWIGLCITDDFTIFRTLSFLCGMTTVTPQLMVPLVGDYAPARRKSLALAVVVSGLLVGVLIARLLSGIVTTYTSWRMTYWVSCGLQYLLAVLLLCFLPDYPSTNPDGLNYFAALWSIPYMLVTEPVLVQACLIVFSLSAVFSGFWTTLTFLLASSPYNFSSLDIGLFSLIGIVIVVVIPFVGALVDRFEAFLSILLALVLCLVTTLVGTFTGTFTLAGPIVQGIGVDVGYQAVQVASRAAIFAINPKARNRLNTAYMAAAFAGQLMGSAVGNRLYAQGGWKVSGYCLGEYFIPLAFQALMGFAVGLAGTAVVFALMRGPEETGWVGWKGGWNLGSRVKAPQNEEAGDRT